MKHFALLSLWLILLCGLGTSGFAQHHKSLAHSHQRTDNNASVTAPAMPATSCTAPVIGYVPQELLQRPVPLRQHLGYIHDKITTASPDAQAFYNQGVAYLHGYVWIEAARSFHQALAHDSTLAMAYVGLSRTYINFKEYAEARKMAEKADKLAHGVSESEKLRIKAQLARLAAIDSLHNEKLLKEYRSALDKALAADMGNAELWLLRGNAEEAMATGIGQQGNVSTIPYYEAAMRRAPEHPAPYHYLVHSYENIGQFHKAAEQGKVYAIFSPGVPHALHMYGHDLMKTGQIPAAIEYLSKADSLEQAYYKGEHIAPELDWHHGHNMSLLGMSHRYLGQTRQAEKLFREVLALKPYFNDYAFMFKADLVSLLLSQGRANEVLAIVKKSESTSPIERAFDQLNAGRAYLILNKPQEAKAAKEKAGLEMNAVSQQFPEWPGFAAFYTQTYINLLDGLILFDNASTRAQGAEKLRQHAQVIRNFFRGPDQWIMGLYELEDLARLARIKEDWALAGDLAEQLSLHDPHYPGSLLAKAYMLEHAGDKKAAHKMFADAAALWKAADPTYADADAALKKTKTGKKQ